MFRNNPKHTFQTEKVRKETYTLRLYLQFMQILLKFPKMIVTPSVYNFDWWNVSILSLFTISLHVFTVTLCPVS